MIHRDVKPDNFDRLAYAEHALASAKADVATDGIVAVHRALFWRAECARLHERLAYVLES